jgi:shikimate dehydrogenase
VSSAAAATPADGAAMRCAVLGSPISHSLSPVLHRAAYDELGLDWSYDAIEVTESSLPAFLDSLDARWRGLSLTMPLKRTVLARVDEASETVRRTGSANTVLRDADGRLRADNTDVAGMRAALSERGVRELGRALILGGGATACSAVAALEAEGCTDLTVAVRELARGQRAAEAGTAVRVVLLSDLVSDPRADQMSDVFDLVVSTIPAAAQDRSLSAVVGRTRALFDVIYHPWPTTFAVEAERSGATVVGGLDLLVHQAALQVELMTGAPAPLPAMRAAGEAALAERCG